MSLFEMIPDRPLIMPSGGNGERPQVNKKFGLMERKCEYCKETFYRRKGEHEYTRTHNGMKVHFCTWSHTCRWEEKNRDSRKKKRTRKKRTPEEIQGRIEKLMRDMARIRAELDSEAGRAMSGDERNKLHSRIRWRVHELEKLLEGLDGETGKLV